MILGCFITAHARCDTADVIDTASSNPARSIDDIKEHDETSSVAAERSVGKLPGKADPKDVKAIEEILKPRCVQGQ